MEAARCEGAREGTELGDHTTESTTPHTTRRHVNHHGEVRVPPPIHSATAYEAASDTRYAVVSATSAGSPMRPNGVLVITVSW